MVSNSSVVCVDGEDSCVFPVEVYSGRGVFRSRRPRHRQSVLEKDKNCNVTGETSMAFAGAIGGIITFALLIAVHWDRSNGQTNRVLPAQRPPKSSGATAGGTNDVQVDEIG